jgi:hypothetical protein
MLIFLKNTSENTINELIEFLYGDLLPQEIVIAKEQSRDDKINMITEVVRLTCEKIIRQQC